MLEKKFIRYSKSDYILSVLIVKKSEENLCIYINYQALNTFTIKNRNVSPLIKNTFARLCAAKIYTKFDIIAVFNKVRIYRDNKYKIVFITRYNLFEYIVILFDLCNISDIFQIFINKTLRKYLNDFCIAYLNNIFIYSKNQKEHTRYIKLILVKLKQAELYLDIDKCEFNIIQVKYLDLIITIEDIKIDSEKIKAIQK